MGGPATCDLRWRVSWQGLYALGDSAVEPGAWPSVSQREPEGASPSVLVRVCGVCVCMCACVQPRGRGLTALVCATSHPPTRLHGMPWHAMAGVAIHEAAEQTSHPGAHDACGTHPRALHCLVQRSAVPVPASNAWILPRICLLLLVDPARPCPGEVH